MKASKNYTYNARIRASVKQTKSLNKGGDKNEHL